MRLFAEQRFRETIVVLVFGPDFVRAEKLGSSIPHYLQAQANMYQQLVVMMSQFNLGSDIVVAGVDDQGARLAVIGHPGTIAWFDKLGYAAIGSGGIHATMRLSLGAQTRNSPLVETLYRVKQSDGTVSCISQTQNVSSQRGQFTVIRVDRFA